MPIWAITLCILSYLILYGISFIYCGGILYKSANRLYPSNTSKMEDEKLIGSMVLAFGLAVFLVVGVLIAWMVNNCGREFGSE